jgi:hypothetical protein
MWGQKGMTRLVWQVNSDADAFNKQVRALGIPTFSQKHKDRQSPKYKMEYRQVGALV